MNKRDLVLAISFLLFYFPAKSEAKIINVGSTEKIKTIKEAVKIAKNGDQIFVHPGIYKESNILINKQIDLIGINNPMLDGESKSEIISIKSDKVKVKGFHLKDAGFSNLVELAGIKIENVSNCVVENNELTNAPFGIYLANAKNCLIKNNKIKGLAKTEVSYGNAIHIWKSENIDIENNDLSGHRDGIYFEFVKNSRIINNNSNHNIRYGLHFMFSDGNLYIRNSFIKNSAGVAVMYTKNIEMIENNFENNWGPSSYGLLLKDIKNSKIIKNKFSKNTMAIYLDGTQKLETGNNTFINNGYALKIAGNSYDNNIHDNNFLANSFDVTTNESGQTDNNNKFSGNYWDKYSGYDLNKDKIGDVPYRPVSVFSMIMEKIPYSVLLLRSFFVSLLDLSEKVMPVFTPKSVIDESPRMIMNK